ncbi:MAG: acyl-CoA carboxylase subunit beta [Neofamilia sp.]
MKGKVNNHLNTEITIENGNKDAIEKQHNSGKLTARERINLLLDTDSFIEVDKFAGSNINDTSVEVSSDSVITGYGTVDGRLVFVYSQDLTVSSGAMSEKQASKIVKIQDMALKMGAPIIGFMDSGGGKIEEGIDPLSAYGKILNNNTISSGVIPQISIVSGACVGSASFVAALTDFVFMVDDISSMFLNGPQLIKSQTNDDITIEDLGGAMTNNEISGVAHFLDNNEEESINRVRELLSFLPSNNLENPIAYETFDNISRNESILNDIVPENVYEPYEMKDIIKLISDDGNFFEIQPYFAPNLITGLIRLDGKTIGVVANQPMVQDGLLDINSTDKGASFIRKCNAFNIPLLNLVDVEGYVSNKVEEHGGNIRHGAKMIFAYSEATVPKVTLIVRKAYGSGYLTMCNKDLGADQVFAWPGAEISSINPEGAANFLFKDDIANSIDPIATRKDKILEYRSTEASPYTAAKKGYIDDIIFPSATRPRLISAFDMLETKRELRPGKKSGNMPV